MDAVYGDYMDGIDMDGIGSIIFNEGSDLTITSLMKRRIRAFGALFVV